MDRRWIVSIWPLALLLTRGGAELRLGREKIGPLTIERGHDRHERVKITNAGGADGRLATVEAIGPGLTAVVIAQDVRHAVVADHPLDLAVAAGGSVVLEVTIAAKCLALGEHHGRVKLIGEGAGDAGLELPVDFEVIEEQPDKDEPPPAERPRREITELPDRGPPPRLVCDRYKHDFGPAMSGEHVRTTFELRNAGEGDLVIQKIRKMCHCTLPKLKLPNEVLGRSKVQEGENLGTLKPGEAATLEVEIDTEGLPPIEFRKAITVFTNDPRSPTEIALSGTVANPFLFTPPSVDFGEVRRGQAVERKVRMALKIPGDFTITGFELPDRPIFDFDYRKLEPGEGAGCAWELVFKLHDDVPCGEHKNKLLLSLEHERVHAARLLYQARVLPDVDVLAENRHAVESVNFGVVRPGTNDVKVIVLENLNPAVPYVPKQVSIESLKESDPFECEVKPLVEGQRYELRVKVVRPPKVRTFSGQIVVRSDHPTQPELRIRFSGIYMGTSPASAAGEASPSAGEKKDH